ncbi:hypothetical protein Arno162_134 [Pectobacterium phage Arno162]|uniref:Uncharacterized protein n=2 Tax=Arnovirus TaxID=3425109 RepID=A0A678ZK70_9CAUD|nr:hypothetical protein Arno162_134 [Pectobacterium phage Arno162]AZV02321.1 hypothetical protein Arno18_135 [Pectobacterium phage Arno18]
MKKIILLSALLVSLSAEVHAATLKEQFINSDGDRICVYLKHSREVYVNVGFSGTCHFNVPDGDL